MVLVAGCEARPVAQLLHLWEVERRAGLALPRGAFGRDEQHQEDRKAVADRGSAAQAASPGRWGAAHAGALHSSWCCSKAANAAIHREEGPRQRPSPSESPEAAL